MDNEWHPPNGRASSGGGAIQAPPPLGAQFKRNYRIDYKVLEHSMITVVT